MPNQEEAGKACVEAALEKEVMIPMIFKPHKYQQHCINKILELDKLGLFLDMGL